MTKLTSLSLSPLKLPVFIVILSVFVLLIIGIVVAIYFFKFNGTLGNQEQFGQFGDYIGGLLNPILSFLTIALLIWSIQVQTKELRASTDELSKSSRALDLAQEAHNENVTLQKRENLRRQIQDDFEYHWNNYNNLLDKKIIRIGPGNVVSLNEMLNIDRVAKSPISSAFIESIPKRMTDSSFNDTPTSVLLEIAQETDYITNSASELFKLLDTHIVACSIHNRVSNMLSECHQLGILEDDIHDFFVQRIIIPSNISADNIQG
jgi:uncharacterized membrane protein